MPGAVTRPFPGFDAIYELNDPDERRSLRVGPEDEDVTVEALRLYTLGEAKPERDVRFVGVHGTQLRDVLWTTAVWPILVRERVTHLFRSEGFTGWDTYPVAVFDRDGLPAEDYCGLAITGRCGEIDFSRSEVVLVDLPGGRFPYYRGRYFDPESWDGSDLFSPGELGVPLVTESVVVAFRRANVRNVRFDPVTESLISVETVKPPPARE